MGNNEPHSLQLSPLAAVPLSILHPYCLSLRMERQSPPHWELPENGAICTPSILRYRGFFLQKMNLGYQWLLLHVTGPNKNWNSPHKLLVERLLHCCKYVSHLAIVGKCTTPLHRLWFQSWTHPAMRLVVITLTRAVPVMGSVASKVWYTAASCFSIKVHWASAPFHTCYQNPLGWHVHSSPCQRPHP